MDSQLEAVRQDIRDVKGKIAKTEQDLAVAEQPGNKTEEDVKFFRGRLEKLDSQLVSLREKENILLRSQTPTLEQPSTQLMEHLSDEMRLLREAVLSQASVSAKSIAFSSISGAAASQLLRDVQLTEVDGFAEFPLDVPIGVACMEPFDYSEFETEDKGTPEFLEYHQRQLEACGVVMGRSGYQVHDLHEATLYHVHIGDKKYSGGIDGGILPFAVRAAAATNLLRIGFEHKQSTEDKATFQIKYPDAAQKEVASPRPYSFKEGRGQVICCLLAAHAMCQLPLILDLTDGKKHHLLRLKGDQLLVYEGCTPDQRLQAHESVEGWLQAYSEMANFLKQNGHMLTSKATIKEPPEGLEEDLQQPIKKLKGCVQGATFADQIQSLTSFCPSLEEQVCTAYQLAREWTHSAPACVSKFYEA